MTHVFQVEKAFLALKPIRTPADYDRALVQVDVLLTLPRKLTSAESRYLDTLTTLVHAYEQANLQITPPTPLEAVRYHMERLGLKQKDLAVIFKTTSRVSEFLAGKRGLTQAQIVGLHTEWGIPLSSLLSVPIHASKKQPRKKVVAAQA